MSFSSQPASSLPLLRPAGNVSVSHKQREGAGFVVRRPFPTRGVSDVGGLFLMLDHFGPVTYGPGEAVGAPDHPHRGFETVTYILKGAMQHKDSAGNSGHLGPGWVQWLTAGRGVVHSEMPDDAIQESGGEMEGFQLWVNLPAAHKMVPPRYQDVPPERIPVVAVPGAAHAGTPACPEPSAVRVVAGDFAGTSAVIGTHTPIGYLDVRLGPGDAIEQPIPAGHVGFAYVYRGQGVFGANAVPAGEGAMVTIGGANGAFRVAAPATSAGGVRCLLIYGAPIHEPIARHGPFVMNTRDEIIQAFEDYQSGHMGEIAGAEERRAQTDAARAAQQASGTWARDSKEL